MLKTYLVRHLQVLVSTLGQFAAAPVSTVMSVGVVGIALALPTLLFITIGNAERLSVGWQGRPQITAFMQRGGSEQTILETQERLSAADGIAQVELVTARQALEEFKLLSGMGNVLNNLADNPLPPSLLILPRAEFTSPQALKDLTQMIGAQPGVDHVALDLEWIERFNGLLALLRRGVAIISLLLGLAVVLIISNTIRLAILNRRDEIEIIKLIGGTNRFIQRPFMYSGFILGIAGAALAWLASLAILLLLAQPVSELSALYGSGFRATGLSAAHVAALIAGGGALGWLAARLSVARHLRDIEPK